MTDRDAIIILNALPGFGPVKIGKILSTAGNPADSFRATAAGRGKTALSRDEISVMKKHEEYFDLQAEKDLCRENGVSIITVIDKEYPVSLLNLRQQPPVIYAKGDLSCLLKPSVAIVGSRRASDYGKKTAYKISYEAASRGISVVSGLARGIDISAHKGALDAGGATVAVLGSGILNIYPRENSKFTGKISETGLVISEFTLRSNPNPGNFPRRNRIISGLCSRVLVIEASLKSGSLITANFALEEGKDVYAVPGRIDSKLSEGSNRLIKDGAYCVAEPDDFIFGLADACKRENRSCDSGQVLSPDELKIMELLEADELSIEDISALSGMEAVDLATILFSLQMRHLIKKLPGNIFGKC
ncbi:MAG: DNA-processing protein DprA [Candidatus Aureabacteria bacterium]|nr:DNA-processing protein DprA [Candidatus Auribacterota bacterium]